jgi:hypothetical protein
MGFAPAVGAFREAKQQEEVIGSASAAAAAAPLRILVLSGSRGLQWSRDGDALQCWHQSVQEALPVGEQPQQPRQVLPAAYPPHMGIQ